MEERPEEYVSLTYMQQDQFKPDNITNVYYGSPEEGNWTYLGYINEKTDGTKTILTAFDQDDAQILPQTADWKQIDRHYQKAGYAIKVKEQEQEAVLKSIRRKKDKDHDKGIER